MTRTGHSSTDGVQAYKRASNKLKRLTSNVLNSNKPEKTPRNEIVVLSDTDPETDQPKPKCKPEGKEYLMPTIQITGGTNITININ